MRKMSQGNTAKKDGCSDYTGQQVEPLLDSTVTIQQDAPLSPSTCSPRHQGESLINVINQDNQEIKYNPTRQLWLLSMSYFFIFAAYGTLENFQSTMNARGNTGMIALGTLYGSNILSGLVAPIVLRKLSMKCSLILAWFVHLLFLSGNVYPVWWVVLPLSCLLGLATGLVWTAQGYFITSFAFEHARQKKENTSATLARFNGIFTMCLSSTGIFGNLFPALLLRSFNDNTNVYVHQNMTNNQNSSTTYVINPKGTVDDVDPYESQGNLTNSEHYLHNTTTQIVKTLGNITNINNKSNVGAIDHTEVCGPNFCPTTELPSHIKQRSEHLDSSLRYILISGLALCQITAIILTFFLVSLPREQPQKNVQRWLGSLVMFKDVRYRLLVPAFALIAAARSLLVGPYNKGFVACTAGMNMVGFTMLTYGVCMMFSGIISGYLRKCSHGNYHVTVGITLLTGFLVIGLVLPPDDHKPGLLFIGPAFVGVGNGILSINVTALLGELFHDTKTEAFAMTNSIRALHLCVYYSLSTVLCYRVLNYITIGLAALLTLCYGYLQLCVLNGKISRKLTEETKETSEL